MAEPVRTGVLASFWYYQRFDFSLLHPDCPLILDSGAFSAFTSGGEVNLADYAAWANGLGDRWDFAFNLDVLGDASASLTNWRTLREHGVNTVPVIHFGDHPDKVWVMPEGTDTKTISGRLPWLMDAAVERRYNVSTRLHVYAWGDGRGH